MKRRFVSRAGIAAAAALIAGGMAGAPALAAGKNDETMNKGAGQAAQSECLNELNKVRDDLSGNEKFRQAYNAGQFGRGSFNDLVDAAQVFARNGMEERCQTVVAGIKEMAAKTGQGDQPQMTDEQRQAQQRQWSQRFQAAKSLDQAEISAETLTGIDVRNSKGDDLGDVTDIVVADGKIQSVIVSRGGFLGLGETNRKLDASKARLITTTRQATGENAESGRTVDSGDYVLVVEMTEQQIESLPEVTKRNGRWMAASADRDTDATTGDTKKNMKDTDKKAK